MQSRADGRAVTDVDVVPDRGAVADGDAVLDERGGVDAGRHVVLSLPAYAVALRAVADGDPVVLSQRLVGGLDHLHRGQGVLAVDQRRLVAADGAAKLRIWLRKAPTLS